MNSTISDIYYLRHLYKTVDDYYSAYILPIVIVIALLNNLSILLILQKSIRVQLPIVSHIRVFYIAFAIADINMLLSNSGKKFLGIFKISILSVFDQYFFYQQ